MSDWLDELPDSARRENEKIRSDTNDTVNHPSHYNQHPAGIECIDVVEHMNFNLGNAIKYIWRAGLKPGSTSIRDLEKAQWYVNREIQRKKQDLCVASAAAEGCRREF